MPVVGPTTDHNEIRHWATAHDAVPIEILPQVVDSIPVEIRLVLAHSMVGHADRRAITWEHFFAKFDQLGLAFVYNDDSTGYNELLQIEAKSPWKSRQYAAVPQEN